MGCQTVVVQIFMERQNKVALAVRSKATGTGMPGLKSCLSRLTSSVTLGYILNLCA